MIKSPPISFVRGGYVSDMNRLGFKEGGSVSKEELTTSVPISKESQILVDNETVPFVDRIINPQDYPYPEENEDGSISTHLLSAETDEDGNAWVFPTKVYKDKEYKTYTEEERFQALADAKTSGNAIQFNNITEADVFSQNYKTDKFKEYYRRKPLREEIFDTPSDIGNKLKKRWADMEATRQAREAGDINLATSTWATAGDIAGGVWDIAGELVEAGIDTTRLGFKTLLPETYEATAETLTEAKDWALDTEVGKAGIETAKDVYEGYQEFKKENPHGAKALEAAGNILPLAMTGKFLKTQIDNIKKTTTPTSTYKYKPNSDTPHINVRDTVQYQGLKDITTDKLNKVNKFFNPDVINKALNSTDINTKVIYMTPGEFLTLAKTHTSNIETKKLDRINEAINKGIQLEDIPTLTIQSGKAGGSQVIKHDGRHRANALYELGEELIPVRVVIKGNKDNKRIFTVTNEDGLEVYTFPNNVVYNRRHLGEAGTLKKENTKATMPAKKTQDPTITQKKTIQKSLVSRLPKEQKGYNLTPTDNYDGTWSQGMEYLDGSTSYSTTKIPYKYEMKYKVGNKGDAFDLYPTGFSKKVKGIRKHLVIKDKGDGGVGIWITNKDLDGILNNTHPVLEQVEKRTMKY